MDEIKKHWFDIIKEYFPIGADLFLNPTKDDFCLDVGWKLKNDQNRPNKKSRKLRLIIPEETIEDYREAADGSKRSYDQKLILFMKKTMNNFEPDHNTPYGQPRPVETVLVTFGITH